MPYTKKVERYISTETIIYDEAGTEVARYENYDAYWYDTESVESLSDEEAEDWI